MANTDNPNGFKFVKSLAGEAVLQKGYTIQSATIAKGDAIINNTAGRLDIALSNSGLIHGIAASAVTNSATDSEIWYYPAVPWYIFEGQCSGTYARTIQHTSVDIEGTTGIMEVNEDATTEQVVRVIGENPNTEIGANSRVWFIIERSGFISLQDEE